MANEKPISEFIDLGRSDFRVLDPNSEMMDRPQRLRFAVRRAGGPAAAATRAGIALTTLQAYLRGGEMKLSNAVALVAACNVTLEWLATGRGPVEPDAASPLSEPQISAPLAPPPPFSGINVDQLAKALQAAAAAFQSKGTTPSMHQLAQVTALLYGDDTAE